MLEIPLICTQHDLIDEINRLKIMGWESAFETNDYLTINTATSLGNLNFGVPTTTETRYAWTFAHYTLNFQGEKLNLKVPRKKGIYYIHYLRPFGELAFNHAFLRWQGVNSSIKKEIQIYHKLLTEGFPTLVPREELLLSSGSPAIKGVLLTTQIENVEHTIDRINRFREVSNTTATLDTVVDVVHVMEQMHHKHKLIWGDAWLGNTFYDAQGKLYAYDFGFRPNLLLRTDNLRAHDFISLCYSAVYRTKLSPEEVIPVIFQAYRPSAEIRRYLLHHTADFDAKETRFTKLKEDAFLVPVYGLHFSEYNAVKKIIHACAR